MEKCSLCHEEVNEFHEMAEKAVLDLIKKEHPNWVEESGACKKCLQYYASL